MTQTRKVQTSYAGNMWTVHNFEQASGERPAIVILTREAYGATPGDAPITETVPLGCDLLHQAGNVHRTRLRGPPVRDLR